MAVSLKAPKHYRAWENKDSFEQSDVVRLFDPEIVKTTKTVHCSKYFTVYSTLIGFFVLFLLGILVGFSLRDDPKLTSVCSSIYQREDGFDRERLQAIHNNIVYYMSGDRIRDNNRELSALVKSTTPDNVDRLSAEYVAGEFRKFGMDTVDVEQHDIVVTSPDPEHPNRLEILSPDGSTKRNFTLTKGDKSSQSFDFSPTGKVKGPVVFGNYGRQRDFTQIRKLETNLGGSIVLLKIGWNSVINKLRLATRYGCSAVLLFCDVEESCCHGKRCGDNEVPDLSTSEFSDIQISDPLAIPVQTVSHNVAKVLLATVNQSKQLNDSQESNDFVNNTDASTFVLLEVYTKHVVQTINNVVATIYGVQEPERVVVIGSQRNYNDWNPAQVANSGILLELAQSMGYIKQRELWKPRRTVRFVSLGSSLPHAGMQQYFQSQKHILQKEGVAFVDLDLGHNRSKVTEFKTDITLVNLIKNAYNMVPDPLNPEISLAESWPSFTQDSHSSNQSEDHIFSVNEYTSPHEIGVPCMLIQSLPVRDNKLTENLLARETTDRIKYQLAVGRVVSHATLMLLDDPILPFNISLFSEELKQSLNKTVKEIEQRFPGIQDIDTVLSKAQELSQMANSIQSTHSMNDCSNIRALNDVLMRFENIFYIERFGENNVFLEGQIGTLPAVLNAPNSYLLSQDEDTVRLLLKLTLSMIQEAQQEIKSLSNR